MIFFTFDCLIGWMLVWLIAGSIMQQERGTHNSPQSGWYSVFGAGPPNLDSGPSCLEHGPSYWERYPPYLKLLLSGAAHPDLGLLALIWRDLTCMTCWGIMCTSLHFWYAGVKRDNTARSKDTTCRVGSHHTASSKSTNLLNQNPPNFWIEVHHTGNKNHHTLWPHVPYQPGVKSRCSTVIAKATTFRDQRP